MKKIQRWMLIATILYIVWLISFIIYSPAVLNVHYRSWTKGILLAVQVLYIVIMWKLCRRWITAAIKEKEDKNELK
jgi:hypothetical protein